MLHRFRVLGLGFRGFEISAFQGEPKDTVLENDSYTSLAQALGLPCVRYRREASSHSRAYRA